MRYLLVIIGLLLCCTCVIAEDTPIAPVINDIYPTSAYNVGVVQINIAGNHFAPGCQVYLVKCGSGMIVGTIVSSTSTNIVANFNLKGISPGQATVKVYNADTYFTSLPLAFTILGDTVIPTPTTTISYTTTITPVEAYTPTPHQEETEPEETITYIYNIPTPTVIVPLEQRGSARVTTQIPSQIHVAETTIKPPTPQIIQVRPTKSPLDISIGIISLLCIIMIIRRK